MNSNMFDAARSPSRPKVPGIPARIVHASLLFSFLIYPPSRDKLDRAPPGPGKAGAPQTGPGTIFPPFPHFFYNKDAPSQSRV